MVDEQAEGWNPRRRDAKEVQVSWLDLRYSIYRKCGYFQLEKIPDKQTIEGAKETRKACLGGLEK